MKNLAIAVALVASFMVGGMTLTEAQTGPFSAQIQRALQALGLSASAGGGGTTLGGALIIDATGIQLSSDGDGALTILGLGDGEDEDLTLNLDDIANVGTFSSSTALATLNFSSIALQESGVNVLSNDDIDASSELLAIMDDETGTGLLMFATSPTITTSIILSSGATLNADAPLFVNTAPTITSGFGTSPSISSENGTGAFVLIVGTGGTDTSGVLAMPTATNGWICSVEDLTANVANAGRYTWMTASSTTAVTLEAQTADGVVNAWAASSVLYVTCISI